MNGPITEAHKLRERLEKETLRANVNGIRATIGENALQYVVENSAPDSRVSGEARKALPAMRGEGDE